MPMLVYQCPDEHVIKRFVRRPKDAVHDMRCPACGKPVERVLSAPNAASVVIMDNGIQAKAVEVNLELVDCLKEQSTKDFTQKD